MPLNPELIDLITDIEDEYLARLPEDRLALINNIREVIITYD